MSRNLAVIPFPHTPNPENEEREEQLSQSLSSSTTGARACARTRESAVEEIAQYYCDTFGAPKAPPVVIRECEFALEQGMSWQLILITMDEAALAPRPSWAYARAIIRRLLGEGVLTPDAYAQRQARWQARRSRDYESGF